MYPFYIFANRRQFLVPFCSPGPRRSIWNAWAPWGSRFTGNLILNFVCVFLCNGVNRGVSTRLYFLLGAKGTIRRERLQWEPGRICKQVKFTFFFCDLHDNLCLFAHAQDHIRLGAASSVKSLNCSVTANLHTV